VSGGFLGRQQPGEHQVVILTFAGALTEGQVTAWNEALRGLKIQLGPAMMAVTIKGEKSPVVG
jgi:hypothetical protein